MQASETQESIRIAIDIRILGNKRTGDETVFFELTKMLLALDQKNEYFLLTSERDEEKKALLYERLSLHRDDPRRRIVTLGGKNRFWWNGVALPQYLKNEAIQVFHTQYIVPFWITRETKVVNHIHDVSFCAYPEMIAKKDLLFLRALIPSSLRRSDAIVVPSAFTKNEVIRYYSTPAEKMHIVANALGTDFSTKPLNDRNIKEKYGLSDKYLLYVGTLQPRKNIPILIRAFAEYRVRYPETQLVIVGSRNGHHFDTGIDMAIAEHSLEESVLFPGYVAQEDLSQVFQKAEVFVFPSRYEGFGIPLLEAMSMEVPIVVSDIPSLREVAADAGLYFKSDSIDELLKMLYSLKDIVSLRETLVARGKERIECFSWEKSAKNLLALYEKLASER